jgi:septal ring factor EnvC (AmiA/AmiB activator)
MAPRTAAHEAPTVTHHESRISRVEAGLDALRGDFDALRGEFRNLTTAIENWRRDENQRQRPQYGALGAFALGIIGITFSFVALVRAPIAENQARMEQQMLRMEQKQDNRLLSLADDYERFGRSQENIIHTHDLVTDLKARVRELEMKVAADGAAMKHLEGRLEDVDIVGSRRWIKGDGAP